MSQIERLKAAVVIGQKMRQSQKDFFKTKSRDALQDSKTYERQFDKAAEEAMRADDLLGG